MTTVRDETVCFAACALGWDKEIPVTTEAVSQGGSDRSYCRIKSGDHSSILVHYNPDREENRYFADIAGFLKGIGVAVPDIIAHDPSRCLIVMEDLGSRNLWSYRKAPWTQRRKHYWGVLTMIRNLHDFPMELFPSGTVRLMPGFDSALYRWERDYFRDYFMKAVCHIELFPEDETRFEEELSSVAERLERTGGHLVHRDLQSQNVMIREDKPFFIDFQGMRLGNGLYDLGSLLYDPYVTFSDKERIELLSYYYHLAPSAMAWPEFRRLFREAAVQRLMQALGAYGYLGLVKGRSDFLTHIPNGLDNLLNALDETSLPCLKDLALGCRQIISN